MFHVACRVALAALFCLTLIPFADAEDIQIAKVYRDYPGYIEPPTCVNPQLSVSNTGHSSAATLQNWNCPHSWTLTPMIGYHLIEGGLNLENNAAFGLAVGYNLTCNWAIEADLRYTSTETDFAQGNNLDVDIWTLGGGALYHFQPEQRLNPYLLAGAGVISYDIDGTSHTDEDYMGFWGGGFKYAMNQNTALRADVRHLLDYRSSADFDRHDDSSWRHHINVMLGLTFLFGN
ncbi:MAG: porin family protein [Desulfuromonadales bacterium]|nr:porin family protein [Desulfuromonadales bacterium]